MKSYIQSFFTRKKEHPDIELIKLIYDTQNTIDIAIYTITKKEIVDAIINAKNRGVKIRIILDKHEVNSRYEKIAINQLKNINIPIKINKHSGLMHLKVAILDNKIVTTGSYNYTTAASIENDEVLVIIREANTVNRFVEVFEGMWCDRKKFRDYG